jgi:hypothetical protein
MRHCLAMAAALAIQVSAAHADTFVALIGNDILANVDGRTSKTTSLVKIDGVGPVLGIDVRPADGQLYALASDGTIAIVDPATGKATPKSKLDTVPPADVQISVDFNPVADKMRIIGADGTNLRADVDSGKVTSDQRLKFAEADAATGKTPTIVAAAYSNSMKGAKETTLYDIDGVLAGLYRQVPPNDGILNTIGTVGLDTDRVGFDIVSDGAGANRGVVIASGKLYVLDLASGKMTGGKTIAGLPSDVRDVAALLAPASKQAANTMTGGDMGMTARAGMAAAAGVQKPMPGTTGDATSKPMQMRTKMDAAKSAQYRTTGGMQKDANSSPRMKKVGPQCDERRAGY